MLLACARVFQQSGLMLTPIAQDLFAALQPYYCKVTLRQNARGGLQMTAVAEIKREESDRQ